MYRRTVLPVLLTIVLAGCSVGAAHERPLRSAGAGAHLASRTIRGDAAPLARGSRSLNPARLPHGAALAHLVAQPIPERNLYALADELKLRPPRRIAHVVRRISPNYPVGHHDSFDVLAEDQNRYFVMHATIRAETPHLYIYVQDGINLSDAATQKAADTFERSIYPADRTFFGSEWRPGVDGDPHITCLVGDLRSSGAAGFYSAEDEYPRLVNPWSNQREMVYINSTALLPGDPSFNQTLAHEFQHMIHWHMHSHDNAWLNEGMSMLAEQLNHYPPVEEPSTFFERPDTQLNTWTLSGASSVAHYGGAYLFLLYVYDRFGRAVIHDIVTDKGYTDFELIDDVLKRHHIHQTALQLFSSWVIANLVNDRSVAGGMYGYKEVTQKATVQKAETAPFSFEGRVPPYAAQYVTINPPAGGRPFRLQFSAPSTVPVVSIARNGPFWWSDRGDMSATSLVRTVDLRRVRHATLRFQTSYDIEKDYDYAYVEVSTDGGTTWQTLPGLHTTTENPNGASYGNGYTGASNGWLTERMDLSRYAGRRHPGGIQLRFQYVTDDEYNGQSFVVRNISIPEIGFRDRYTGWQEHGFVPVGVNALPSHWVVQLVAYNANGVTVSSLPLAHSHGSIVINPASQGLKKLIVAVFTSAPKTTVDSSYQLSVSSQ